ncbi:MAG TPA: hypothetical protein VGE62_02885 [Candidatus Paceibacterota bacterium]
MELLLALLLSIGYAAPFLYKRSPKSFIDSLAIFLAAHLAVGLSTQYFKVFSYPLIIGLHVVLNAALIGWQIKRHHASPDPVPEVNLKGRTSVFWMKFAVGCAAILVIAYQAYSVHYRYTGFINDIRGTRAVLNGSYDYPYYSDEWVAVSMIKYSIESKSLALVNPLDADKPFMHFLSPFYSLVSELTLFFGLNPLTGYAKLALGFSLALFAALYSLMRIYGVGFFASAVGILAVAQITNGANLATSWYLIPYLTGLIFLVIFLAHLHMKHRGRATAAAIASGALYPPMAVFIFAALVPSFHSMGKRLRVRILFALLFVIGLFAVMVTAVSSEGFSIAETAEKLFGSIARDSLLRGAVADYKIWYVMPLFFVPFAFHGFYLAIAQRSLSLSAAIGFGLLMWIVYPHLPFTLFMEHSRIVAVTAFLLLLAASFSFEEIFRQIESSHTKRRSRKEQVDPDIGLRPSRIVPVISCFCVGLFVLGSFGYTQDVRWVSMRLKPAANGNPSQQLLPAAPANRYLHPDDLALFADIKEKRFIAPAWKGLVVGVATGNYPLDSKNSTISNSYLQYSDFARASCDQKLKYITQKRIEYIYGEQLQLSCTKLMKTLTLKGSSEEDLYLYKTSYVEKPL